MTILQRGEFILNITGNNNIYNIPFDQYQRYKTASLVIEKCRKEKQSFTILEIGANEHKNLEKFLPSDIINYLDIKLPEHLQKDKNYILADATNMPQIKDNSFDIIIALDVFEHIPQNLRNNFLSELNRVSKELVILAGPFDEPNVSDTEKKVNEYYKKKYGEDYIWLKEHIENKLPDLNVTINYLNNDLQCNVDYFSHGSLEIWEKLMQLHFEVASDIKLQNFRMNIDNFYNKYLYMYDVSDKNYREFLVVTNKENNKYYNPFIQKISNIPLQDMEYFDTLIESLYTISANSEQNIKQESFIQLFIENENGISEENSIKTAVEQNNESQEFEFDVSNKKNITLLRLDPLNDYSIIKINKILLDDVEIKTIQSNACYVDENIYYFNTNDPQIYIDVPNDKKVDKLIIDLEYLHIGEDALNHVVNDLLKAFTTKEQNIQSLSSELESKEQNIQSLSSELESKEQNIQNKCLDIAIVKQKLKLYHPDIYYKILGEL